MELHLFRHGETDWNELGKCQGQSDSKLTQLGVSQAKRLRKKIANIRFHKVFCSSSLRARQTAEQMWPENKTIILRDSFMEISLGAWEGLFHKDINLENPVSHNHFLKEPHLFKLEGAETFFDVTIRAVNAITKIAVENEEKIVALVSHGAFIKCFLNYVEGRDIAQLWTPPHIHNCAHSIIHYNKASRFKIIQYADIKYSK